MSKKEEPIFRVYVKERRGNFRIAISKKILQQEVWQKNILMIYC